MGLQSCLRGFVVVHASGLNDVNGVRREATSKADAAMCREMQCIVLFGVVVLKDHSMLL